MARRLSGFVDVIAPSRVAGWVWNEADPSERLRVTVRRDGTTLAEAVARRPRPDLARAGIGDGSYAFEIVFDEPLSRESLDLLVVEVKDAAHRLPATERALAEVEALEDCQLNVYNFERMRSEPPRRFGYLRFDPNNDCNLHCVYCHNPRSKDVIATEDFRAFLHENVQAAHYFQIGCAMEPTLDPRLCDLMLLIAQSPAKPQVELTLQTNGILLARHDHEKMRTAEIGVLSVSVDAAEPSTQKLLRNGTSLDKVIRNVVAFRRACPSARVEFITTVTRANVDKMEALVLLGVDIGVAKFVFREVFYHPQSSIVDHTKMPALVLEHGSFDRMRERLLDRFGRDVELTFADGARLERLTDKMRADSHFA